MSSLFAAFLCLQSVNFLLLLLNQTQRRKHQTNTAIRFTVIRATVFAGLIRATFKTRCNLFLRHSHSPFLPGVCPGTCAACFLRTKGNRHDCGTLRQWLCFPCTVFGVPCRAQLLCQNSFAQPLSPFALFRKPFQKPVAVNAPMPGLNTFSRPVFLPVPRKVIFATFASVFPQSHNPFRFIHCHTCHSARPCIMIVLRFS